METHTPARVLSVLHVNTGRAWRGGERQTLLCAARLSPFDFSSCIAAPAVSPLIERARKAGITTARFSPRGGLDIFAALALRRIIKNVRADIVHAHTAHAHTYAALACLGLRRTALIATRRVDSPLSRNPLSRLKYGRCDAVIAISENIRRACIDAGVPPAKVVRIYSGIDLSVPRQCGDRSAVLAVPPGHTTSVIAGTVAALTPEKDIATLVDAAAIALRSRGDILFYIVGDGPQRRMLAEQARRLGIDKNVVFTGFRDDAEQCIAAFDIFVLPSKSEGLGSSVLDAMASGKAIAASRAGGVPEMIDHGVNGLLFAPGDAAGCAACIVRLAQEPLLRRALGAAALKRVVVFDIRKTAAEIGRLYRRAATAKAAA